MEISHVKQASSVRRTFFYVRVCMCVFVCVCVCMCVSLLFPVLQLLFSKGENKNALLLHRSTSLPRTASLSHILYPGLEIAYSMLKRMPPAFFLICHLTP